MHSEQNRADHRSPTTDLNVCCDVDNRRIESLDAIVVARLARPLPVQMPADLQGAVAWLLGGSR